MAENRRLSGALNQIISPVYMKDLASRFTYANEACLSLLHCTEKELIGNDVSLFYPPETVELLHKIDQKIFLGNKTSEEISIRDDNGKLHVFSEVKTSLYAESDSGKIIGLLGIAIDITEQKKG